VNVAGVLLARAEARRREIAIRMAIGSSRLRIVSQLMTESLLLGGAGGVCGTIAAAWGVHALPLPAIVSFAGTGYRQLSAFDRPAVDLGVLVFALAVTLLTSILFGLAPALETSRTDLVTALKQGDRAAGGRRPLRALGVLVVGQVAVAVLLLEGAGLLLRSFAELQTVRRGFVARDVLTFWVSPPASRYRPEDGPAVIERLLASIQRVPGVAAAAANRCTPLAPSCARTIIFFPEHPADPAHAPVVGRHYVSEEYFGTLGIPIRAGRVLAERDRAGSPPVAVVNETAARRFWPGENPVGKHVWFGSSTGFTDPSRPVEIVGVVGDVKYGAADEAIGPDFYTSYRQFAYPDTMVMVKTSQDLSLVPALRRAVASVDPALPIYDVQMLDDRIAAALSRPRHNTALIATFAMTALLLAAVGVYGLVAYSVSFRHREIGIRLALGAAPRRVANIVLRDAARLAGLGAAIGVAGAMVAALVLRSILFHVAPYDPVVFLGTLLAIGFVAILAAYAPARRVSAVDPMIVLRAE
jgi:predicted permease